jgi:mercuric ion transport protein
MTPRNKVGAIVARLTCPCHAAMLLFVLAGTGAGTWLAAHQAYLYLVFTLAFLAGLWLMVRRSSPACTSEACQATAPPGSGQPG